ncbi:hypothetical protein PHACT_10025 [Pseudohongiella acticola]|uniref:Acyl carrier protein n=1 Tax=Pseudohongiella acticola TaxID=1524254 RepID=A0A1E8CM10_9GAMM|nr:DUF1493 family protein [Pseudohongiella acticola]OFE13433.1 hypothetical protein PHACT_10025 [Pseudohongiella acticola]
MESEIIAFVSEFTGVKAEKISPDTLINFDLGVDGDDGTELLEEFSARFGVDLSPIPETYFGPEGVSVGFLVLWPYYLYRRIKGYKPKGIAPLSVGLLVKSAESGKWASM